MYRVCVSASFIFLFLSEDTELIEGCNKEMCSTVTVCMCNVVRYFCITSVSGFFPLTFIIEREAVIKALGLFS